MSTKNNIAFCNYLSTSNILLFISPNIVKRGCNEVEFKIDITQKVGVGILDDPKMSSYLPFSRCPETDPYIFVRNSCGQLFLCAYGSYSTQKMACRPLFTRTMWRSYPLSTVCGQPRGSRLLSSIHYSLFTNCLQRTAHRQCRPVQSHAVRRAATCPLPPWLPPPRQRVQDWIFLTGQALPQQRHC